jgi:hypothetical protein
VLPGGLQRALSPSSSGRRRVALAPQGPRQRDGNAGIVLDEQHPGHAWMVCRERAHRTGGRNDQRPGQRGVRFSAKARTPSARSPLKAVARQQASSISSPLARSTSKPRRMARLADRSPTGELGRSAWRAPGRAPGPTRPDEFVDDAECGRLGCGQPAPVKISERPWTSRSGASAVGCLRPRG